MIWANVRKEFNGFPAREAVARKMIELGLCVRERKVFCGQVEVKENSLAKAAGVDRRAVRATTKAIAENWGLKEIFSSIEPAGALVKKASKAVNCSVVEIEADATKPGILSNAAFLLAEKNISVMQAFAQDPRLVEKPKLTIVTSKTVPGVVISKLTKIRGVTKVSVL